MSTWKLTKKLKETHLSSPFSPRPSVDSTGSSTSTINLPSVSTHGNSANGLRTSPSKTLTKDSFESTSSARMSSEGAALPSTTSSTSTIKPGLLTVSINNAMGLSLPPGHPLPPSFQAAFLSTSPRKPNPVLASSSSATKRKPPVYLVLEYDKNQVILDASGGSLDNPVWDKVSNFDVSRAESLTVQIYARIPIINPTNESTSSSFVDKHESGASDSRSPVKHQSGSVNAAITGIRRRYEDVFLGSCKVNAGDLSSQSIICDEWLPLTSGTGKVNVKIEYQPNQNKHLSIEDFDLLKVVGKGSFGKVMQVKKIDTQRIYALKTLRKAHIVSRSEVNHTLAERTVLAQIDNPFIVPLKFSFQSPEKLYLVLAFVNGGELFHHLQREGRFDLNRSRFYCAELLCALECLHEYNVIYRDLKPENILLDYTGHIALCDFGLCKLNMTGQEKTNTFCGTPEYLAPELLLGQGYTKVVDWWTLGVLFYEMLTGLPPFYDQDTNEMYRKILQEPLRFPDDMDREARSLLTKLLNRDPKKRLGINGAGEIKAHPFFAQIDWKRLMNKKYAAPFKPAVESATDTSNFDAEFTNEVPTDSVVEKDFYLSDSVQKQFGGWTYTNNDSKLATSDRW